MDFGTKPGMDMFILLGFSFTNNTVLIDMSAIFSHFFLAYDYL